MADKDKSSRGEVAKKKVKGWVSEALAEFFEGKEPPSKKKKSGDDEALADFLGIPKKDSAEDEESEEDEDSDEDEEK